MYNVRILVIVEERPGKDAYEDIDITHLFRDKAEGKIKSEEDLDKLLAFNVRSAKGKAEAYLKGEKP